MNWWYFLVIIGILVEWLFYSIMGYVIYKDILVFIFYLSSFIFYVGINIKYL